MQTNFATRTNKGLWIRLPFSVDETIDLTDGLAQVFNCHDTLHGTFESVIRIPGDDHYINTDQLDQILTALQDNANFFKSALYPAAKTKLAIYWPQMIHDIRASLTRDEWCSFRHTIGANNHNSDYANASASAINRCAPMAAILVRDNMNKAIYQARNEYYSQPRRTDVNRYINRATREVAKAIDKLSPNDERWSDESVQYACCIADGADHLDAYDTTSGIVAAIATVNTLA